MTITVTPRASAGESTGSAQTKTTTAFTPTANSKLYVFAGSSRDSNGIAIDLTIASNTGGLTFTEIDSTALGTTGNTFGGAAAWEADVGASPSSMTVTFDAGAGTIVGYIAYSVFDATSDVGTLQTKSGQVADKMETDAGGNTETHTTGTLPSAATTGNATFVGFSSNSDSGGSPAVPTSGGFSAIHTTVGTLTNVSTFKSTTFTGTSTVCPDLGDAVNGSGSVLWEVEEVLTTSTNQEGFRFRNDNGSETTATWVAAQDTNVTAPLGANIRLRALVDATGDPASAAYTLNYKKSTDSTYIPVQVGAGGAPVIEGTAETAVATAGTSHAITLPASIVSTDRVVILMDIGSTSATLNALANWTEVLDEASANGLKIIEYTGAGVPSNPTFTSSASTRSASIAYRISGSDKTIALQIGTTATGTSVNPNPPSVTPTSGTSKPYLFIAFFGCAGEEADDDTWVTAAPTNYSGILQKACGTVGTNLGGVIGAASRTNTSGAAEDPATFTIAASLAWRAQTIIVHPLAAPPIYVSPSANVTAGGEATTAQLTAPSGKSSGTDFQTGRMWDDANGTGATDLTTGKYSEFEWSLQAQSPAVNTDVYQFRVYAGATPLTTYGTTAQWTIGTATGSTASGAATQDGNTSAGTAKEKRQALGAPTQAAQTSSAVATHKRLAVGVSTQTDQTSSAVATHKRIATGAITQDGQTSSGVAKPKRQALGAITQDSQPGTGITKLRHTTVAVLVDAADTSTGSGTLHRLAVGVAVASNDASDGDAVAGLTSGAGVEENDTSTGVAKVDRHAVGVTTQGDNTSAGTAKERRQASGASLDTDDTSTGTVVNRTLTQGVAVEQDDTSTGVASSQLTLSGNPTAGSDTSTGTAILHRIVAALLVEADDTSAANAVLRHRATGAALDQDDSMSGIAAQVHITQASGAAVEADDTSIGVAKLHRITAAALVEQNDTSSANAVLRHRVTGTAADQNDTSTGLAASQLTLAGALVQQSNTSTGLAINTTLTQGVMAQASNTSSGVATHKRIVSGAIPEQPDSATGVAIHRHLASGAPSTETQTATGQAIVKRRVIAVLVQESQTMEGDVGQGTFVISNLFAGDDMSTGFLWLIDRKPVPISPHLVTEMVDELRGTSKVDSGSRTTVNVRAELETA